MTTLVLGASGFIGSWVVRTLLKWGVHTSVLTRSKSDLWRLAGLQRLHLLTADERDWAQAITSLQPAVVVSLDWSGVGGTHRDDELQWNNLARQKAVLEAAFEAGARRFVGVGSQAEYGPKNERIAESATTSPRTLYGKAKLAAMEFSREFCESRGMEWAWARVFSVFGPLDNGHWLLPLIADSLLADHDIELTSGEQRWSYLYASDAGTALAGLATHAAASGIYNVGNPLAPKLRDTVELFASHFQTDARLLFGALPLGPNAVIRLEPDVSRLEELGWSPLVTTNEGLESTAQWLRGDEIADPFSPRFTFPRRVK